MLYYVPITPGGAIETLCIYGVRDVVITRRGPTVFEDGVLFLPLTHFLLLT